MQWIIAASIVFLMLGTGYSTADGTLCLSRKIRHRTGKTALFAVSVILPILIYAVVWLYNGISICSFCRSVTDNSQTEAPWITRVDICRKCVEYVDSCKMCAKYEAVKSAAVQQRCRSCDGYIDMNNDEIGECFVQILLFLIVTGHLATLTISGIVWIVKNKKKRIEE